MTPGYRGKSPKLLTAVQGVEFIGMEGADSCCCLGGSFGITHREASLAIQAGKMQSIKKTNAEAVVTSCPGCLIQLMDGSDRHRLPVKVIRISQLICGQTERHHTPR
jgi:glycolate oxidase iron-sulfur subunit